MASKNPTSKDDAVYNIEDIAYQDTSNASDDPLQWPQSRKMAIIINLSLLAALGTNDLDHPRANSASTYEGIPLGEEKRCNIGSFSIFAGCLPGVSHSAWLVRVVRPSNSYFGR